MHDSGQAILLKKYENCKSVLTAETVVIKWTQLRSSFNTSHY